MQMKIMASSCFSQVPYLLIWLHQDVSVAPNQYFLHYCGHLQICRAGKLWGPTCVFPGEVKQGEPLPPHFSSPTANKCPFHTLVSYFSYFRYSLLVFCCVKWPLRHCWSARILKFKKVSMQLVGSTTSADLHSGMVVLLVKSSTLINQ